jgi:DNA-binding NarL/FixJ family response regulator
MTGRRQRILIVDDHPIVRRGLRDLISLQSDLEVCGEAGDVAEALRLVEAARPDLIIIDLYLRDGHGIQLIERIKARNDRMKMLVSSMHDEVVFAERVLRAGAMGYITKQEPTDMLLEAIRRLLRGEVYLSARMANRLLAGVVDGQSLTADPIGSLSNREIEVFEMIGHGWTTQQIALALELSHKTVETYREKIKGKLNLKNSAELCRRAIQWTFSGGLVQQR